MMFIRIDERGRRFFNFGDDGPREGQQMADQLLAIILGWGLAIDDELKGKP